MRLSTKLNLSVLVGLLALLGVLGYLGLQAVWESTDRTMDERLVLARMVAQDIDQDISERLQQLEQFAGSMVPYLEDGRLEPVQLSLEQLYRYGGAHIRNVFVLDEQGRIVWIVPASPDLVGKPLAFYPNVRESIDQRKPAVSGAILPPDEEGFFVSLSVPVLGQEGDTLGVLGTILGPASAFLQSLLSPVDLGQTGYAQVINERGSIMATSDSSYQRSAFPVTAHADRFTDLIEKGEGGVWTCHRCHEPEGEGERRQDVMAFAPLTTAPWGVAIRQDKGEAFAPRNDLQRKFFISGSVALGLALAAAIVVGQTLSRPLRRLTLASQRIAAGDLEHPITIAGKDEVGQLGSAFEVMRQRVKQSRQELEERSRTLAALEERDRIAREMHDSLSQALSYIRLTVGAIKERLDKEDLTSVRDELEEVRQAARDAYEDVRQGIFALRANGALQKQLLPALQEYLEHYRAQTKLEADLIVPESQSVDLSEAAQVQALRIIQEALANVRKHAGAHSVRIEFSRSGGWVQISVLDDGQGFDPARAASEGQRFGLQIMRERAESVGGTLDVISRPGAGTRLIVRLPSSDASKENPWSQ